MKSLTSQTRSDRRLDPSNWIREHRDYLVRYALPRVSDYGVAEDLVQDTFVSAWNARKGFRGDCTERTWLTGVLRNKIVDYYRRNARRPLTLATDLEGPSDDSRQSEVSWMDSRANSRDTFDPDVATERAEFMSLLDRAVDELPSVMGKAFRMREMHGQSTEEITRALDISKNNLWVLIHRAKQLLKQRLGSAWFGDDTLSAAA